MLDRVLIAAVVIGAGVVAYRVLLMTQHARVSRTSRAIQTLARPALFVFTSPTCAPCKLQQIPIINKLLPEWGDRVELRIIDVTVEPEMASQFAIWSVPTTVVLDSNQRVVAINQGVAGEAKLRGQMLGALEANAPDETFSI